MTHVPKILEAYIDEVWLARELEEPVRYRSRVARILAEPQLKQALEYLVRLATSLEALLARTPGSLRVRRRRIGAELMSKNVRNVMGILAELDELDYLLPRARDLEYFPEGHHPDFEMDLAGRSLFEEVTTLRGTERSIREDELREDLDWDLAGHASGYALNVDYGRGPFDKRMRDGLKTEITRYIKESPAEGGSRGVKLRDADDRVREVVVRVISARANPTVTVLSHSNWDSHLNQRDKQIWRALNHKKSQFEGHGPNILVLDGSIDYWPFHVSNVLRGNLAMAMRPVPEEGRLEPIGLTRTSDAYFDRHPEVSAVVFKPRVRPGPTRLVFLNGHGIPLTDKEIMVLGKVADEVGY